ISTYQYLDFWFRFPTRYGTLGVMFRPMHDKSRQDMAVAWEIGADSTEFELRLVYGLEDLFNNLWAFRQTRVGNVSEPYIRHHPWEPGVEVAWRHELWRAELAAKYLTPATKSLANPIPGGPERHASLWGTLLHGRAEANLGGFTGEIRSWNQQALSDDQPVD